ncbi:Vi polysaccharide biosynthesis protein VipA/TviB [Pedobacter psychrophilus]|uniref:Vi polysaccharide biosynthesis protein VipA/TviB n=1 Tax=Pedobacter psychrophilus TaxID=1826909 RepID=A0A179DCP6_9SPHI|nr:nucleotide sugar dehydrogenase [Pedobacter psychrophilus]OAQ38811.1 Vi polysaccharide biosynthesis protein VipA/TviB [Pedobacter psychrophilus]
MLSSENKIAVIGLGYVGLPLAAAFGNIYETVGFDIDIERVNQLENGIDLTKQLELSEIKDSHHLSFSNEINDIASCNIFIITVPTPINQYKAPDLSFLLKATSMIGSLIKKDDLVIYESTVYPGCTEEDCVPLLEKVSNLLYNQDFFVGYSPERINPGDKINTLTTICKVTSGSNPETALKVDSLYKTIIKAGTYLAPSIKVAEASKAIENAQRDVNISFVNELALICDRLKIDTNDVLDAAATKWNFLKFKPGLVGGHCIGVDPYYLAHKAESLGYHPQVILSGRRVNDNMGMFVANKLIKLMLKKEHKMIQSKVLILGFTFKENCPDIRNTRVIDIYKELIQFDLSVDIYDPWADAKEVENEYHIKLIDKIDLNNYQAIVITVAHQQFLGLDYQIVKNNNGVIFDTKSVIDRNLVDARL